MNYWLLIPAVCGITLNAAVDFTGPGFPPLSLNRAGEAATVPVRQTVTVADFRDGFPDIVLNKAGERGQKLTHAVERGALLVEWRRANAGYWEWSCRKPVPLPEFTSARFEVKLTAGSPEPPEWFSLRLADATGEVFQYAKRTDWDRDGICNLVFELERSQKPVLSWGGNGDGRLDFPVKFLGASGDFKAGEGEIGRAHV